MALDEATSQRLAQIDQLAGKVIGEEKWVRYVDAIKRDRGSISEQEAVAIANSPDPIGTVERMGKEAMLARMPSSTRASNDKLDAEATALAQQSERNYAAERQEERTAWLRAKGRIP